MNKFRFFTVLFFFILFANAQNSNDSLNVILSSSFDDSIKVKKLLKLTLSYQDSNPKESLKYLNASKVLLSKSYFKNGWIEYLLLKSRELNIMGEFKKSYSYITRAKEFSKKYKMTDFYLRACCQESFLRARLFGEKNAVLFLQKVFDTYKETKNYNQLGDLYSALGRFQQMSNFIVSSLDSYKNAVSKYRKVNNTKGVYSVYYKLCEIYVLTKDKINAPYYLKLLKNANYKFKTDRDYYYESFLEGDVAYLIDDKNKALECYKTALKFNDKFNDNVYRFIIIDKMIKFYLDLQKTNEAINFCLNEMDINLGKTDFFDYFLYINASLAYHQNQDLVKAKLYFQKANYLFLKLNSNQSSKLLDEEKIRFYQYASRIQTSLRNYQNACKYHELYIKLNEDYLSRQNTQKVHELQALYEANEKESKIKQISIQNQKKDALLERNRLILLAGGLGLIFAISLILFLSWIYHKNKKHNKLLNFKNQIIENKNKELLESSEIVLKALSEKDILLKEIHHRVKNNLQLMMSLLNIQARESVTNVSDFVFKSQSRISSMALIHQNLYETDNFKEVDFKDYVEKLVSSIEDTFENKSRIKIVVDIKSIFLDIQTSIPLGLIINELVTNAFKHAFLGLSSGEILIHIENKYQDEFELKVSDNGVGYDNKNNIKKTLGLELVELLTIQMRGKFSVKSERGTICTITFKPYSIE